MISDHALRMSGQADRDTQPVLFDTGTGDDLGWFGVSIAHEGSRINYGRKKCQLGEVPCHPVNRVSACRSGRHGRRKPGFHELMQLKLRVKPERHRLVPVSACCFRSAAGDIFSEATCGNDRCSIFTPFPARTPQHLVRLRNSLTSRSPSRDADNYSEQSPSQGGLAFTAGPQAAAASTRARRR